MTVAVKTPMIEYVEDGTTLAFPVPFRFGTAADLQVKRISLSGVVTTLTAWSATGGATDAGGTVTLVGTVGGSRLRIRRTTTRAQQTDYETNDTFPAESHEAALDRLAMVDQEQDVAIADMAQRAPMVPEGEIAPPFASLTGLIDGDIIEYRGGRLQRFDRSAFIGKFFAGDASGRFTPASGTGADSALRTDLALDAGALLMGHRKPGSFNIKKGAAHYFNTMLPTIFDGYDASVVGVGNDDSVAAQAFANYLTTNPGGATGVMPGTANGFAVAQVNLPAYVNLDGRATGIGARFSGDLRRRTTFRSAGPGPMFLLTTLSGLNGFDFEGKGAGVLGQDVAIKGKIGEYWSNLSSLHFNNFGDEAVVASGLATNMWNMFATNMLMTRARSARTGILRLEGTDHMLFGFMELSCSLPALYSTALNLGCIYAPSGGGSFGNHQINAVLQAEISEFGLGIEDYRTKVDGGRSDLHFGPGCIGTGHYSNFHCHNNSRAGDGFYSGWETTGNLSLSNCSVISEIANRHDWGVNILAQFTDDQGMGSINDATFHVSNAKSGRVNIPPSAITNGNLPRIGWGSRDGTTAQRPTDCLPFMPYNDRTLARPIWRNALNTGWIDSTGAPV